MIASRISTSFSGVIVGEGRFCNKGVIYYETGLKDRAIFTPSVVSPDYRASPLSKRFKFGNLEQSWKSDPDRIIHLNVKKRTSTICYIVLYCTTFLALGNSRMIKKIFFVSLNGRFRVATPSQVNGVRLIFTSPKLNLQINNGNYLIFD